MGDQGPDVAPGARGLSEKVRTVKKYVLFDHDGVLVDTEFWYFKAAERALADIGFVLDKEQYLRDMTQGLGSWAKPGRRALMSKPRRAAQGARRLLSGISENRGDRDRRRRGGAG